jgi:hypothetical protein
MFASAIPIDINDAVIPFDGELVFGNVCHAPLNASDRALVPQFASDAIPGEGSFAGHIGQRVSPFVRIEIPARVAHQTDE